jgi:DNA-binding beta-propeller fold protein YncE
VGNGPSGIAFDGSNVWVTNGDDNTVSEVNATSGISIGTFSVGTGPQCIAFDGANIWVANYTAGTLTKLRAADGSNLGTFTVGSYPLGVAFDGVNIWVVNIARALRRNSTVYPKGQLLRVAAFG